MLQVEVNGDYGGVGVLRRPRELVVRDHEVVFQSVGPRGVPQRLADQLRTARA